MGCHFLHLLTSYYLKCYEMLTLDFWQSKDVNSEHLWTIYLLPGLVLFAIHKLGCWRLTNDLLEPRPPAILMLAGRGVTRQDLKGAWSSGMFFGSPVSRSITLSARTADRLQNWDIVKFIFSGILFADNCGSLELWLSGRYGKKWMSHPQVRKPLSGLELKRE